LAIAGVCQRDLLTTCGELVKLHETFEPNQRRCEALQEIYAAWKDALRQRGYLGASQLSTT
jgi:hypothetical protein